MSDILAIHAIITPNCRRVQGGDLAAFEEAVRRLREQYEFMLSRRGEDGSEYHLKLSVVTK